MSCNSAVDKSPDGLSALEWSSIRAAYEAHRHAAVAVAGGYQARNPGQRWLTRFDGRGASTRPDSGGWTWGLELERYGFAGMERAVCEPTQVSAQGQRVAYDWDATLREWWINDTRGLEHGYTIRERPPQCGAGPLTLTLAVRGDLQARVQTDGRGVRFSNNAGVEVLTYSGLEVFDADGNALPAHIEQGAGSFTLEIDERGARYPLTIDPIAQQAYLKASNSLATAVDEFGFCVSVSGDTVVVGAPYEDSNATGVNGIPTDNSATDSGAAFVFVRSGTSWSLQGYLKASNTASDDLFGVAVSVSGDTLVVGAPYEDSNATGADGNQADNSAPGSGAVYVFVRSGTIWSQQAYLKASNTQANDFFGLALSNAGDTVVVGADQESSNATGVNGNQLDNSAQSAGAVYVFVRNGTTWSQQAYLKASNTAAFDRFGGKSVSVSGDTIVVGAIGEDSNATGVNGNQIDNSASSAGAAYIFVRSGTTWSQQAYLKASNTGAGDIFGHSVSVSSNTVLVSAPDEGSNATGVNGNQFDNSLVNAGAAYVFVRSGTTWSQQAYLKASNTGGGDVFGSSVSVSGDTVVVGAPYEDSNATGANGNQLDNGAPTAGAAYVFVRSGTSWSQQAYLKASNTGAGDLFGWSVSVSTDTIVAGAYGEDSPATGVNGNQADNSADAAGAAYFLVRSGTIWTQQAYAKGSDSGSTVNDLFGTSVSVSGDTVVVGALGEDSSATGVNGVQNDDSATASGAAYVFVRNALTMAWSQQAYLKASNTEANDGFGQSVSISGDTLVVGAGGEDSGATGVDGNQLDNSAGASGAAYVFVRSGTSWSQQAYLKASNTGVSDSFGFSVSLSGNTLVVGAPGEDSNATGVNGNQLDNGANAAGAAYVFVRSGTSWSQQAYLKASNTGAGDQFGGSVCASGDTVVVGAALEDSNATDVNGNQADNSAGGAGATYVFVRSGTIWSQQAYLKASNTGANDNFGGSVSVSTDTLVVGARSEGSNATGVNGNQLDNSAGASGAAYVFVRSGTTWSQQAYIKASNTAAVDHFGHSVSLSGDTLLVSANGEDSNAIGVNGDQLDNSATDAGAVYVFLRSGTSWSQQAYLKASNTGGGDRFGVSVAVSGSDQVVGADREDSNASGVGGNQLDDSSSNAGAVYVFAGDSSSTPFCFGDGSLATPCPCGNFGAPGNGCANSVLVLGAHLASSGTTNPDTLILLGSLMPPIVSCIYLQGDASNPTGIVFGDGLRCVDGALIRLRTKNNVGGASQFPDVGDPSVSVRGMVTPGSGAQRFYQTYYRNSAPTYCPPETFNVTNGLKITW